MKIVIAPNALKDCLSAHDAAHAMQKGAQKVLDKNNVILLPVADGGDGFAKILSDALLLGKTNITVTGPLNYPLSAPLYLNADNSIAVLEMASIAGLALLSPQQRQPLLTSSYGIGEAIKLALDKEVKRIIIGIGGSATNDAGIGMASALGVKFSDRNGNIVKPIGSSLTKIVNIDVSDIDTRLKNVNIDVACDVNNSFHGPHGAVNVFAAQKGANAAQRQQLERGMRHFANVIDKTLNLDISALAGAGAAGGLGGALQIFCQASLSLGIDLVLDQIHFDQVIKGAALVLTAEGRFDKQTQYGKAPAGVAKRAKMNNIPCILLAGSIDKESMVLKDSEFTAVYSISPERVSIDDSLKYAADNLTDTTEQVMRRFLNDMD